MKSRRAIESIRYVCDICGAEVKLTFEMCKTQKLEANPDIQISYFDCPECGHRYNYNLTDTTIRQLIKQGQGTGYVAKLRGNALREMLIQLKAQEEGETSEE